ncbi:hypothetical protein CDEST_11853 [Colletotrichum destructivum]|uniref:Uncharacterized protein n=1 Tax=Colletotrichum destructivum TaxID=34406 RepID=A0AAX4IUH6_9PEZI|nr:hypothetical protein CDEST_11853 [Colletotrichum destructivum]
MMEPSYSRSELLLELTSCYEFLAQLFLPPKVIQYPPKGCWGHITPGFVDSCLGKDDISATAVDFTGDLVLSLPTKYANKFLFKPEEGNILDIPPHVFVYATIPSGRDGHYICIDTMRGTIVLADPQTGPSPTRLSDPQAPDEEAWRRFETYTFDEFFSMAKKKFRKFEMKHVHYTSPDTPQAQIHREEDVFTEQYNRERCMDRLDGYQEQKVRKIRQARKEEVLPMPSL